MFGSSRCQILNIINLWIVVSVIYLLYNSSTNIGVTANKNMFINNVQTLSVWFSMKMSTDFINKISWRSDQWLLRYSFLLFEVFFHYFIGGRLHLRPFYSLVWSYKLKFKISIEVSHCIAFTRDIVEIVRLCPRARPVCVQMMKFLDKLSIAFTARFRLRFEVSRAALTAGQSTMAW